MSIPQFLRTTKPQVIYKVESTSTASLMPFERPGSVYTKGTFTWIFVSTKWVNDVIPGIDILKVISVNRVRSLGTATVAHNNNKAKIDPSNECTCCNMKSNESLEHLLFTCPQYNPWRVQLLEDHLKLLLREDNNNDLLHILRAPSEEIAQKLHLYVRCVLKQRRLLTEE